MFNKFIGVGNLTRDIEIRYSNSGVAIANTGLAMSRKFTKDTQKSEEVCFVDITFFGRSAEIANQYLRKGSKILVEGRLNFEQWVDQNGGKRSKHSVTVENMQMLDARQDDDGGNQYSQHSEQQYSQQQGGHSAPHGQYQQQQSYAYPQTRMPENTIPEIDISDSEIPF